MNQIVPEEEVRVPISKTPILTKNAPQGKLRLMSICFIE
jgi:hypothetical protein